MRSPHQYKETGRKNGVSEDVLNRAIEQIENVVEGNPDLPAILTLKHLSLRAKVSYSDLLNIVGSSRRSWYKNFSIRKRSGGRRFIYVPEPSLYHVQKWINKFILRHIKPHEASHAFAPNSSIFKCSERHCGAQWLIKMDITGFFESISEIQIYRVFRWLRYQPLVAFELARLTTIAPLSPPDKPLSLREKDPVWKIRKQNKMIPEYSHKILGYLPQGAPTSPMLSNLVMRDIDGQIATAAKSVDLIYTRYSDDLTFSSGSKNFDRKAAAVFVQDIGKILATVGFRPQHRKTAIIPPGARKIVLGLLVDGERPRLRREFKDNLRMHLHYLEKFGPSEHAEHRGFHTIWGLQSHLRGLIDFAKMIEPEYAGEMLKRFSKVEWPY